MKKYDAAKMKEKWKAVRSKMEGEKTEVEAQKKETKTPKARKSGGALSFVVHEHHATHLHWDFRLEMDGAHFLLRQKGAPFPKGKRALRSWAVPKGPPTVEGVKRLAVETEEHALEYGKFEGEIPEGQYGAGEGIIWDNGTYELESLHEDKIVFVMKGAKMKGRYCLIRMERMGPKNWLLFKTKDKKE